MPLATLIMTVCCVITTLYIIIFSFFLATRRKSSNILIVLSITAICGYLLLLPPPYDLAPQYRTWLLLILTPNIGLNWWFLLSVFDDNFEIDKFAWVGMIGSGYTGLFNWASSFLGYGIVISPDSSWAIPQVLISIALIFHILWVVLRGYESDLIDTRRIVRILIIVLMFISVGSQIIENYTDFTDLDKRLGILIINLPTLVLVLIWLVKFELNMPTIKPTKDLKQKELMLNPKDVIAYKRLMLAMEVEKIYLTPNLSVSQLARKVGVPDHQLRYIINQSMGYRNFGTFLAKYRVTDIRKKLSDPELARTPILTIALEGGFSSLATFNRTFRSETGYSAGTYRREALTERAEQNIIPIEETNLHDGAV